jgi:glutamine phosphoribosylpyrophosphate amidotransferase
MAFNIPRDAYAIMGHTRMTTQGSASRQRNNHPFLGKLEKTQFALAHNGVLSNDEILRKVENLPQTNIETDSFVAVQLIEKESTLDFNSLKAMAEKVKGTFTFTVLDQKNNLYIIKGNNPLCLYYFPKKGIYIYASTEEILLKALGRMQVKLGRYQKIDITCGDILTINKYGNINKTTFSTDNLDGFNFASYFWRTAIPRCEVKPKKTLSYQEEYIERLKVEAEYCGYSPSLIDTLLADGFSTDDIEEMIYCGAY